MWVVDSIRSRFRWDVNDCFAEHVASDLLKIGMSGLDSPTPHARRPMIPHVVQSSVTSFTRIHNAFDRQAYSTKESTSEDRARQNKYVVNRGSLQPSCCVGPSTRSFKAGTEHAFVRLFNNAACDFQYYLLPRAHFIMSLRNCRICF